MSGFFTQAKTMRSENSFEWKMSAIQTIGMYIGRTYGSPDRCFNAIATSPGGNGTTINYNQFKRFLDDTNVLTGFNLTPQL